MKLTIRRIGNSFGAIIPREALDRWRVGEGDMVEIDESGIRPARSGLSKTELNELRLERAMQVVRCFAPREIRAKGLANLHRWKRSGSWGPAYGEWDEILRDDDDGRLFAAMLGRDEDSVRLRQSAPYVGLLPESLVREMNEKVAS
jgi:antitoxin component of MazEF toxin-antitoxin module